VGDNIKMDLKEVGFWGMDWIELAQDRNRGGTFITIMNLRVL
jgi:hypothetical protein